MIKDSFMRGVIGTTTGEYLQSMAVKNAEESSISAHVQEMENFYDCFS